MSLQFVACVLSSTCAWATEYHWIYQQGSSAEDAIRSATSDSAGDIVGSGYTLGDFSTANEGQQDIIVVKVSSTGALLWSVQKSTEYEERSYAVSVDSSDSIFVAGYTFGEMDLEANAGTSDVLLVKFDSAGTQQWTVQRGSPFFESSRGMALDVLVGDASGEIDSQSFAGMTDFLIMRFDKDGVWQWTRTRGSTDADHAFSVAVDSAGNIIVTGETYGSMDSQSHSGGADFVVVKYDSSGNWLWTSQNGTSADEYARVVQVDSSDNAYVAGIATGSWPGYSLHGLADVLLMKLTGAGDFAWAIQRGSTAYDEVTSMDSASSQIFVCGYTTGDLDGHANSGQFDMFVMQPPPQHVLLTPNPFTLVHV
ncbi:unnamed protein product [Symbiodinium pilosum]|uniref:Bulb-type lectin domain-containing protein n=1 Tax=Symbiodinium pilosum TaxID=2952 RepID=A0A812IV47_SYMPI|nr:unnamed protein product [Symbiodinium pilosum]